MMSGVLAKQPNVISEIENLKAFIVQRLSHKTGRTVIANESRNSIFGDRLAIVSCNEYTYIRILYLDFKQIQQVHDIKGRLGGNK